ncbi:acyl-CoA dehydrogenase family protein [Nocardia sp. NPDC059180]|uniref:acyl-CoA dehydrogenase family protein n=1 Tax=Nocardia sp. NPDC059180 TaxID=3346761 RepID=UPI0036A186BA
MHVATQKPGHVMDFEFDETQLAVAEAVQGVLSRGPAQADAWGMLQDGGVHVLALPEERGGAGLGAVEVGIVAQALGEAALTTPFLGTGIAGLVASRSVGVDIDDWCKSIADGAVTAVSVRAAGQHEVPGSVSESSSITGVFGSAQHAEGARWLLAPTADGPVLIDLAQDGVAVTSVECSLGTEAPETPVDGRFELTDVRCTPLLTDCPDASGRFTDLYRAVFLSYASGLLKGALHLTADHLGTRKQFGRPLATFQAASQEIADIYVLSTALESVSLYSNWTIDSGGSPGAELDAALFMFAGEGRAAMQMCHHLHGGLGVDITYPMHRYFSAAKDVVRHCGGERQNLRRLGTRCSLD